VSKKLSAAALTERLNQAITLLNSGALDAAISALQGLRQAAPKDPNILHLLGRAYSIRGQTQDAIPLIEAALAAYPNFADAHFSLAAAYQQCGRDADAIHHFRQSLALAPEQAIAMAGLAFSLRRTGAIADASIALSEAIRRLPGQADWHLTLAEILVDLGQMADAIPQYRQAITLGRQEAPIWNNLGMALKAEGDFDEAERAYQNALERQPNFAQALNNLGSLWRTRGREEQAFRCFQRAVSLAPNFADPYFNQAIILVARQQMEEADSAFRQACSLAPQRLDWLEQFASFLINRKQLHEAESALTRLAEAHNTPKHWLNLATIKLCLENKIDAMGIIEKWLPAADDQTCSDSIESLQHLIDVFNTDIDIIEFFSTTESTHPNILLSRAHLYLNKFRRYRQTTDLDNATATVRYLLRLMPNDARALTALGLCYSESNKVEQALEAFKAATDKDSNLFVAHATYAFLLSKIRKYSEAIKFYQKAYIINQNDNRLKNNYGVCLIEIGEADKGLEYLKDSIDNNRISETYFSNMLFTMHFSANINRDKLFEFAKKFNTELAAPLAPTHGIGPRGTADKKLKIGFVSNDFRKHVVNMFFEEVLKELRKHDAEFHLFSNAETPDEASERLMAIAHEWHNIHPMTDNAASKYIQEKEIDILVDLSGHTAGNRLLIFARRPAPVQISWLGYFATTGLTAMDYIFGDPICTPPALEPWFTESVYRLPDGFACYAPPTSAPTVAPLPALTTNKVTFVSANQLGKLTEATVDLWCALLRLVPDSRLALRTMALIDPIIAENTRARFTAQGIDVNRLDFINGGSSADILRFYNEQADIALDPFPCVGGTTTCEALWMGVPVVTLLGDRFAGRHSASHLTNVGVPELVATTPEQYLDIAASLAKDLPRLADLRARLRPMMAASPLCDAPRFAANLMQAFRACWQDALNRRQQA